MLRFRRSSAPSVLVLSLGVIILQCGSETSTQPDATPPAAVADLAAQTAGCDAVSLSWTAPGDDGSEGRAASYDVRRSTATITETNWASAVQLVGVTAPKTAGAEEGLAVSALTAGTTYYFALKTTDDAGNVSALSNVCHTVAGSLDIAWVYDGLGADQRWVVSLDTLSANWAGTCADSYEYAIGTTQGATDVVSWTSTGTATFVTRSGLTLADDHTYYFSARAVKGATTGTPTSTNGVRVDYNVPNSSVSPLPAETPTLTFTVSWMGNDATSGIKWYEIQKKDGEGDWAEWLTETTLTSSEFTGVDGHIYYFRSRAWDKAGNEEAYQAGADASTTVNLAGKPQVAWVIDGPSSDLDWTRYTTTLSASWAAASGGDGYEYAAGTSAGGADVVDWTSVGTETHITVSELALAEGQIYYSSVRVVVGAAHGGAVSSDGITADITPATSAIDPLPPVVTTERFMVTWTGSDALSGISGYNIQYKDGDSEWGSIYGSNPATSFDFPAEDGHTYYFRSRAFDNAGNVEAFPDVPDASTTVALPPIPDIAWVNDGLGADLDWTNCKDQYGEEAGLSANWPAASGVDGYQYAIGNAPGDTSFYSWSMNPAVADTFRTEGEPWFEEGATYYFSVRGVIESRHGNATSSDGVSVDRTPPTSAVASLPEITNTRVFNVSWSGADALSGLKTYTIRVKQGAGEYADWLMATSQTSADFTGEDGHTYYFQSQATDTAGNVEDIHSSADASTTVECAYVFRLKWGSEGNGPGELDSPAGVEVDAEGNVWVADTDNGRVQKFSPEGDHLMTLGQLGSGDGEFTRPADVAFDDSGYVYVVDRTEHSIQKFTSGGTFVKKWGTWGDEEGEMSSPYAIDIDDSGYVYVADVGNERVQKFTSAGGFVTAWGDSGSGEGQFLNPRGVAVDGSGTVYVSDADNANIQAFTSGGTRLRGWGCPGSADGCLNMPYKLAVDDSGYVFVADLGNHRIQKFTSGGAFVAKFGSFGQADGHLDYPGGVALGDSGYVYTVEHVLHRVQKFQWSCP